MAINKNHEFEDLDSIKCAIVEKNASPERVAFLKQLLEFNKYQVVVVGSPAPKAALAAPVAAPAVEGDATIPAPTPPVPEAPPAPTTFTVGVTDLTFNATNAIFGRQLKTDNGTIVTLAYWQEKEAVSNDEVPYFDQFK
ncbi:MAG: hypothetical protein NWS87_05205 [Sediminibacterium sp.]|jgi:hypothetical protein|nr:hypothetical protein [Sediminibacterium sp.]